MSPDTLLSAERAVTLRETSLVTRDMMDRQGLLRDLLTDGAIWVTGAAGSIGRTVVNHLVGLGVSHLVLIDQDENGLTRLVRELRVRKHASRLRLDVYPLDFAGPLMPQLFREAARPTWIMHFAAAKHVRAERNWLSAINMLRSNVLAYAELLNEVHSNAPETQIFAVSTDKAANPTSLMGASKRIMEDVGATHPQLRTTYARFANVTFSQGSLLESWLLRLQQGLPLSVPMSTRRYFISHTEAADICLLSCLAPSSLDVVVPKLNAVVDLVDMQTAAERFLNSYGLAPEWIDFEQPVGDTLTAVTTTRGRYPVVITEADTAGDKSYEEFWESGDQIISDAFHSCLVVRPTRASVRDLEDFVAWIRSSLEFSNSDRTLATVRDHVGQVVSSFATTRGQSSLDDRL